VAALLSEGHGVRVLDNLSTAELPAFFSSHAPEVVIGDVTDIDAVSAALDGVDAVCHQAAKVGLERGTADLADYARTNDVGTAVVLAAMDSADVRRLVLASSMVVYGEGGYDCGTHGDVTPAPRQHADLEAGQFEPRCPRCAAPLAVRPVREDARLCPRNGYAATKVAQENLTSAWTGVTGGSAIALRYHNVYGPRMPHDTPYAGVAALFRAALLRDEPPRVFEDGRQLRDFIHVRDVARANVLALRATGDPVPAQMTPYNVASGRPATVLEMAQALAAAMEGPAPVVTGEFRPGDVRHVLAEPTAIGQALGFRAAIGLDEGMAEFARESGTPSS